MNLKGSASYVNKQKESGRVATLAVHYSKNTETDELFFSKFAKEKIDYEDLDEEVNATHVVTGITWGGNCTLHCSYKISQVN